MNKRPVLECIGFLFVVLKKKQYRNNVMKMSQEGMNKQI